MTYDLTIGKRELITDEDELYETVNILELPEAPALPGAIISRNRNHISIPWGGYGDFRDLLFQVNSDLATDLCRGWNDSDFIPITPGLVEAVSTAIARFKTLHPAAVAAYNGSDEDATLARLEILLWWSAYSLATFGDEAAIQIS